MIDGTEGDHRGHSLRLTQVTQPQSQTAQVQPAMNSKKSGKAFRKAAKLSFADDMDDDDDAPIVLKRGIVPPDHKKNSQKQRMPMARPNLREMSSDVKNDAVNRTQVSAAGEYTAEKMAQLLKNTNYVRSGSGARQIGSIDPHSITQIAPDEDTADNEESSILPNAVAIREARIRRERIRQHGMIDRSGPDSSYIPLATKKKSDLVSSDSDSDEETGGRLVREEQEDQTEEFEGEDGETLHMSDVFGSRDTVIDVSGLSGLSTGKQEEERQKRKTAALKELEKAKEGQVLSSTAMNAMGENGDDSEEEGDDEVRRWELQQIRKGGAPGKIVSKASEELEKRAQRQKEKTKKDRPAPPSDLKDVIERLSIAQQDVQGQIEAHEIQLKQVQETLEHKRKQVTLLSKDKTSAEDEAKFFLVIKSYVIDLLDFLDVKAPMIEGCQDKVLDLERDAAFKVRQKHQNDLNDTVIDIHEWIEQRRILQQSNRGKKRGPIESPLLEHVRNIKRENRLRYRVTHRSENSLHGLDCLYDYDVVDQMTSDLEKIEVKRREVVHEAYVMFDDASSEFNSVKAVKTKFEDWKRKYYRRYMDSYTSMSLPPLFAPLVRRELIPWRPLLSPCGFEKMDWYKTLFDFGVVQTDSADEDPDDVLVPVLVERVVVPWVRRAIRDVWNVNNDSQCESVRQVIEALRIYVDFPQPVMCTLVEVLLKRLGLAATELKIPVYFEFADDDVSGPQLPANLIEISDDNSAVEKGIEDLQNDEGRFEDARLTCRYLFYYGIRLLRSVVYWFDIVDCCRVEDTLVITRLILLEIINNKLLPFVKNLNTPLTRAKTLHLIINTLPKKWKENGEDIPQIDNMSPIAVLKDQISQLQQGFVDRLAGQRSVTSDGVSEVKLICDMMCMLQFDENIVGNLRKAYCPR